MSLDKFFDNATRNATNHATLTQVRTAFAGLAAPTAVQQTAYSALAMMVANLDSLGAAVRAGGPQSYVDSFNNAIMTYLTAHAAYTGTGQPFSYSF